MWTWFTSQSPQKQALAIIELAAAIILAIGIIWYRTDRRLDRRISVAALARLVVISADDPDVDKGWWNVRPEPPVQPARRDTEWVPRPARQLAARPASLAHTREMRPYVPLSARLASTTVAELPAWACTQLMPAVVPARLALVREHQGATPDWSPTGELQQLVAGQFTPTELLDSHVIFPEVRLPDMDALAADVAAAFEGWDDLFTGHWAELDRIIAAHDSPAAYRRYRGHDETQLWPVIEVGELVAA